MVMWLLADVSYGAALKEGVITNGITVASWIPYIISALVAGWTWFQVKGPGILEAIAAILGKKDVVPGTDPKVSDQPVVSGLMDLFNHNLPLVEWFLTLPPDRREAFWVAVKKRLGV